MLRSPKFVDYKNTQYLKEYVNPYGRIVAKRRSKGISAKMQRQIQNAVKRARYMALLQYVAA